MTVCDVVCWQTYYYCLINALSATWCDFAGRLLFIAAIVINTGHCISFQWTPCKPTRHSKKTTIKIAINITTSHLRILLLSCHNWCWLLPPILTDDVLHAFIEPSWM